MRSVIDYPANRIGISLGLDPVENDVGHGNLACFRLGTSLEVYGARQAVFLGKTRFTLLENLAFFAATQTEA